MYCPTQLHKLIGSGNIILQEADLHIQHLVVSVVACNEDYRFLLAEQLYSIEIKSAAILLFPEAQNTVPAIAATVLNSLDIAQDALIAVLSADHVIRDQTALLSAQDIAIKEVKQGDALITFGIAPVVAPAETGHGYTEAAPSNTDGNPTPSPFSKKINFFEAWIQFPSA